MLLSSLKYSGVSFTCVLVGLFIVNLLFGWNEATRINYNTIVIPIDFRPKSSAWNPAHQQIQISKAESR